MSVRCLTVIRNVGRYKSCGRCNALNRRFIVKRYFASSRSGSPVSKLGVGGQKWARLDASQYASVLHTALDNGITTLESGQDGETALVDAYKHALEKTDAAPDNVCMTARLGYRTLVGDRETSRLPHDVTIEEHPVGESGVSGDESQPPSTAEVVHNISRKYVEQCLDESPLVQLRNEDSSSRLDLIYMLHNPEVQGKDRVLERMVDAFCGLEEGVGKGQISSFGVCSNGLTLPDKHPLHLPFTTILEAATRASETVHGNDAVSGLTTLQLPMNLLEVSGFLVARDVQAHLAAAESTTVFPSGIDVYAMRPLTCFLKQGTGTDHPLNLIDYPLPVMGTDETTWTHRMEGPPPNYGMALNAAMGHFDATEILEAQQERELAMEERETLDGCKLLHSMIHDLDVGLESIQSFSAYEEDLYTSVIPLIHDTFEELDEESATILQNFFAAHGLAVRHSVAKRTRALLKEGSKESPPYDIPDDSTLQDFALKFLLGDKCVAKVIVGCEQPSHVMEAVSAANSSVTGT